mmetsp:Transcript_9463/g.13435  ORF Transcript_9463/g.13435 Transcript_9463/m.13435 type:complete len:269 (+) Transcript_9463:130-936(+)
MPVRGVNAKAQAGRDRKAEQKAAKDAEVAKQRSAQEEKEWAKGANARGASRAEAAAAKADEAARKRAEKAALLAAEESEMSLQSGSKSKKVATLSQKKNSKKKKGGGDLSLLEDALVSGAEKKFKKKQRDDKLKKEQEEMAALKKQQAKDSAQQQPLDPLLANTQAMIGSDDAVDDGATLVGRQANKAIGETNASGIDAALGSLSIAGGGAAMDEHPEKRMKAAHKEFEERMLPIVKQDYPGLRLTQYKEKIFNMWKKSPENPMNQQP